MATGSSTPMLSYSLSSVPEAREIANLYLSKNKSRLAKVVKDLISSHGEITADTLATVCRYLQSKAIPISQELVEWCKVRTGLTLTTLSIPESALVDDQPVEPGPHVEVVAVDVLPPPPEPTEANTEVKQAKKRGRPKGSKTVPKEARIEPVEISEEQLEEIREAEEQDSHLLTELIPCMGKYVEDATSRFSARAVHLTLKGHFNYIDLLSYYRSRMPERIEIVSYSLVREVGLKRGYHHTHVLLCFNTKIQVRASFFDYRIPTGTIHPNIRAKNHRTSIEAVVAYHYKDGDFPHTNIRIKHDSLGAEKLTSLLALCPSEAEAIARFCKPDLSNVRDITLAYERLHLTSDLAVPLRELRLWQQEVLRSLRHNVHRRQILFVVDLSGKGGKSSFAGHVSSEMKTVVLRITNSRDAANLLAGHYARSKDKNIECLIFDFTKSVDGDIGDIFDFLEQVRDGRVSAGKYVGSMMTFNPPPQVMVFTNKHIDISKLTADRFRIWYLLVNHETAIGPVGKAFLKKYVDEYGCITPANNIRYTSDINTVISDVNREYIAQATEAGFLSDGSSVDDGPNDVSKFRERGLVGVGCSIQKRMIKMCAQPAACATSSSVEGSPRDKVE